LLQQVIPISPYYISSSSLQDSAASAALIYLQLGYSCDQPQTVQQQQQQQQQEQLQSSYDLKA